MIVLKLLGQCLCVCVVSALFSIDDVRPDVEDIDGVPDDAHIGDGLLII
jgi:hypothetical protein